MLTGTFARFKNLLNSRLRFFSIGMLTLMSGVVFSTSLMAQSPNSCCSCRDGQRGPQGNVGPTGLPGENSFGGLNNYASFQLLTSSSTTQITANQPIPFGTLVAGIAGPLDPIFPVNPAQNSMFNLEAGDYKIAVGISTFGILGMQLQVYLNGNPIYNWPLNPTTTADTTFIEMTLILEVTDESLLQFSVNETIPSTPVADPNTLQAYLSIEKIF